MYMEGRFNISLDHYAQIFQCVHSTDPPLPRCHPDEHLYHKDGYWWVKNNIISIKKTVVVVVVLVLLLAFEKTLAYTISIRPLFDNKAHYLVSCKKEEKKGHSASSYWKYFYVQTYRLHKMQIYFDLSISIPFFRFNSYTKSKPAIYHFNGGGKNHHLQMESKVCTFNKKIFLIKNRA